MTKQIPAIPTTYSGVNFRSRLEANWAAFFDIAGWRWEYEPPEQPGWIPDFLLIGAYRSVKVEVKPIVWLGTEEDKLISQAKSAPELEKVRAAYIQATTPSPEMGDSLGCEETLVLGAFPHYVMEYGRYEKIILGIFLSETWGCEDVALLQGGYKPNLFDFRAYYNCFAYRMGGQKDGDSHLSAALPGWP